MVEALANLYLAVAVLFYAFNVYVIMTDKVIRRSMADQPAHYIVALFVISFGWPVSFVAMWRSWARD